MKIEIESAARPEVEPPLPGYHELLDLLCRELGVPGSPTFREAVAYVKSRLTSAAGGSRVGG
jgi:hypothetical protein